MKYYISVILLCLLSTMTHATFELEDPADPNKQLELEKQQKPIFSQSVKRKQVIVNAGTSMYLPVIEKGECVDWRHHESETAGPFAHQTRETLLGGVMKTVECTRDSGSLQLSLVATENDGLIWVETGKLLTTD